MSKQRMINTHFWDDTYIINLDPIEKLLFLYFLTNPVTDICGIYEIPLKRVAYDTGIDRDMVEKILKRFEKDKKIFYLKEGYIFIVNFSKHQQRNPSVTQGVSRSFAELPNSVRQSVYSLYPDYCTKPNLTKPNLTETFIPFEGDVPQEEDEVSRGKSNVKITQVYESLLKWAESRRHDFTFADRKSQYAALAKARKMGVDYKRIKNKWVDLESDEFWSKKGFDFHTVVKELDKK